MPGNVWEKEWWRGAQCSASPSAQAELICRSPCSCLMDTLGCSGQEQGSGVGSLDRGGRSWHLASASFAMAISSRIAHTCLCGCWFWLVYCSLPVTSQHLPVAGVETAEQLQSGCCRAQQPRFGLYHISGAQKPQTKGMSELQSVGKIFWKQGGTRLS